MYELEEDGGRRIDVEVQFKWGAARWLGQVTFSARGRNHAASENMDSGVNLDKGQGSSVGGVF